MHMARQIAESVLTLFVASIVQLAHLQGECRS
jgi:hypothetical protein